MGGKCSTTELNLKSYVSLLFSSMELGL
jgi:hypothetical protein